MATSAVPAVLLSPHTPLSSSPVLPVTSVMILQTLFNLDNGYLEGLVRGFKCGILKQSDYLNLVQCETLEGEWRSVL